MMTTAIDLAQHIDQVLSSDVVSSAETDIKDVCDRTDGIRTVMALWLFCQSAFVQPNRSWETLCTELEHPSELHSVETPEYFAHPNVVRVTTVVASSSFEVVHEGIATGLTYQSKNIVLFRRQLLDTATTVFVVNSQCKKLACVYQTWTGTPIEPFGEVSAYQGSRKSKPTPDILELSQHESVSKTHHITTTIHPRSAGRTRQIRDNPDALIVDGSQLLLGTKTQEVYVPRKAISNPPNEAVLPESAQLSISQLHWQ